MSATYSQVVQTNNNPIYRIVLSYLYVRAYITYIIYTPIERERL